jgi:hypothetical protein
LSYFTRQRTFHIINNIFSDWQEEEGPQSMECIQANQIFPKKPPVLEEGSLQVRTLIAGAG